MRLRRGKARGTRRVVGGFALAAAALMLTAAHADAARRHYYHHHRVASAESESGWREGFASIVVDAKTGKVLQESNADKLRHPASLTKIMTLYLLFEQIEAGKLRLDSKITVSAHAADAAPTKLGLDPGEKIEVEDAIKAVVTRSANDIAIAIGETIGGTEENFAALMTKKARALGMKNTVFRNASGLPNPEQVTTARDLSILGRAIQDRFPRLYKYFSTRVFVWRGTPIPNHNHLLGRDGVDGIKTGYTRASGFNLVTSVKRDNRFVVAVVLGGRSAGARDARMVDLIDSYMPRAYAGARTAPMVAEAQETQTPAPAKLMPKLTAKIAAAIPLPRPAPAEGSREPIRPVPVKTYALGRTNPDQELALAPSSGTLGTLTISPFGDVVAGPPQPLHAVAYNDVRTAAAPATFTPAAAGPREAEAAPAEEAKPAEQPAPQRVAAAAMASLSVTPAEAAPAPAPAAAPAPAPVSAAVPEKREVASLSNNVAAANAAMVQIAPAGWQVQIGAYAGETEAESNLRAARAKLGSLLANAKFYTEKTFKGSVEYVRARFAGFHDEADAKRACDALRKNDFQCFTVKN